MSEQMRTCRLRFAEEVDTQLERIHVCTELRDVWL